SRWLPTHPMVLTALALGVLPSGVAHPQEDPGRPGALPTDNPSAQRMLAGDDAKRVEEMEKTIAELRRVGKIAEARGAARTVLEIRTRAQGVGHWQTIDARWRLLTLERIAALPRESRDELSETAKIDEIISGLHQQGRYAAALPHLGRLL